MNAEIQYADRFNQPILFEGMAFNKIYPTDIDAITEYHNRLFIIMEVKGEDVPLCFGQITALTRMVDALQDSKKEAILFICRHQVKEASQPIILRDTVVSEVYWNRQWYKIKPKPAGEAWFYALQYARKKEMNK